MADDTNIIQRINYGILFQITADLHFGTDYWSHTFEVPLSKGEFLDGKILCQRHKMCQSLDRHYDC